MYELIKLIFDICLFKKGPAAVPYSVWLLRLLLVIDIAVSFLLGRLTGDGFRALLQAFASVLLLMTFAAVVLAIAGKSARFIQTATALIGADTLISFFAIPGTATMSIGQNNILVYLTMTGLIIWQWAITGHIIRNALGKPLLFGFGLAFLYVFTSYQVMALLFPDAGTL